MWDLPGPGIELVSCFARQILNHWATREAPFHINLNENITADKKGKVARSGPSSQPIIISVLTFADASSGDAGTSPKEAPCPPGKRESSWLPCWGFKSNAQMGSQLPLSALCPPILAPVQFTWRLPVSSHFSGSARSPHMWVWLFTSLQSCSCG